MGKILLSGFNKLDPSERAIVDSMLTNYKRKIERFPFEYLKLDLKQKPHSKGGKKTLYELKGSLKISSLFTSKSIGFNLFAVIDEVFEKLLIEAEHKLRKN